MNRRPRCSPCRCRCSSWRRDRRPCSSTPPTAVRAPLSRGSSVPGAGCRAARSYGTHVDGFVHQAGCRGAIVDFGPTAAPAFERGDARQLAPAPSGVVEQRLAAHIAVRSPDHRLMRKQEDIALAIFYPPILHRAAHTVRDLAIRLAPARTEGVPEARPVARPGERALRQPLELVARLDDPLVDLDRGAERF